MSRLKKGFRISEKVKCINESEEEISYGREYEILDYIKIEKEYQILIRCDDGWGRFYPLDNFTPLSVIRLAKLKEILKNHK